MLRKYKLCSPAICRTRASANPDIAQVVEDSQSDDVMEFRGTVPGLLLKT